MADFAPAAARDHSLSPGGAAAGLTISWRTWASWIPFGLIDGASVDEVLADESKDLAAEFDAVDLFDVQVGSTVYRVFLLPGNLQVDLSFTP